MFSDLPWHPFGSQPVYYVTANFRVATKHTLRAAGVKLGADDALTLCPSSAITLLAITTGCPAAETLETSGGTQLGACGAV